MNKFCNTCFNATLYFYWENIPSYSIKGQRYILMPACFRFFIFCSSSFNVVLTSKGSGNCLAIIICADVFHAAVDTAKCAALAFFTSCDLSMSWQRGFA